MPLALSNQQLNLVTRASQLLPPSRRDNFLRSIASRLDGAAHPSDSQIEAAINFILSVGGVSVDGSVLLCNSSTKGGHHHGPTKQNAIRR
jgi:hypothetical protein